MTGHLSWLNLERFTVDDLPADARESTRGHLEVCDECRRRLDELERERESHLRRFSPESLIARIRQKPRPFFILRLAIGLGALGLVAAALTLVVFAPGDRVRLKGTAVAIYRQRGDEVRLLGPEQGIRAGDALRVVLTLSTRQPVAAWFVDAQGRVDRFLSEGSAALERGERPLPGSAIVESPCVDLWLVVATGTGAAQRLESAFERARMERLPPGERWAPTGSVVRALRCE